jgi:ribosomal protein S18 acetylase RimI-like enzyme
MTDDFPIRRAFPDEAASLSKIALAAKAHWGYPERWLEIWMPQLTFSPEYFKQNESWVAEEKGLPIAFCTLQEKDGNAWIGNLWVSPECIGKGVGKTLFSHVARLSGQRGYQILRLEADPNAVGFYEKMGMRRIGERHAEVEGHPRVLPIMEISLSDLV